MKPVKLLLLLVILAIGVLAVWKLQSSKTEVNRNIRSQEIALMFPDLKVDDVFRIEISSLQNDSLLFRKEAGVWEISKGKDVFSQMMANSQNQTSGSQPEIQNRQENPANDTSPEGDMWRTFYRADPEKVQAILDAFVQMQHGTLKTDDPEKQATMKVQNSYTGTEVIFYDAQMNPLAHLFIGDIGSSYQTTIVRQDGSNEIYEVPVGLSLTLNNPVFSLRDRNIYRIPADTVTTVSVNDIEGAGAKTLNLSRVDGVWTGTDMSGTPLVIDPAKVTAILDALGNLSANSFVDMDTPPVPAGTENNDPYGLVNPTGIIQFTTADAKSYTLTLGKKDGSTYYASVNEYPNDVFRVSDTVINTIALAPANLAPGAESTNGSAVSGEQNLSTSEGEQIPQEIHEPMYNFEELSQYGQNTSEYALVQYMIAWRDQNWNQMSQYVELTWKDSENDPVGMLEAWHDFKILKGFQIESVTRTSSVANDITYIIEYEFGTNNVVKKRVTARVIRESAPYTTNENGRWGVNPTSTLAEEDM
ncbi:MAG: DUF4340 domain-containing protein [bacterium]|nr:DUF4340 domain-containing protein [bacterium]